MKQGLISNELQKILYIFAQSIHQKKNSRNQREEK